MVHARRTNRGVRRSIAVLVLEAGSRMQLSKTRRRSSCLLSAQVAARSVYGFDAASLKTALNTSRMMLALSSKPPIKLVDPGAIDTNPKLSAVTLTSSGAKDAVATPYPG